MRKKKEMRKPGLKRKKIQVRIMDAGQSAQREKTGKARISEICMFFMGKKLNTFCAGIYTLKYLFL